MISYIYIRVLAETVLIIKGLSLVKYYVYAITTGYLTLPPGTQSIMAENVEVFLLNEQQKSTEPFTTLTECLGGKMENNGKEVPIELGIKAEVEASTETDAIKSGKILIEDTLDLISLASCSAISPVYIFHCQRQLSSTKIEFSHKFLLKQREVFVWNDECENIFGILPLALEKLPNGERKKLMNALWWRRKASVQNEVDVQFLFFWFAIESLAQMVFVKTVPKSYKCSKCKEDLVCTACKTDQKGVSVKRAIQGILVKTTHLWSKTECDKGYQLRSKVAHGNTRITPDEQFEMEKAIPKLNDTITNIIRHVFKEYN